MAEKNLYDHLKSIGVSPGAIANRIGCSRPTMRYRMIGRVVGGMSEAQMLELAQAVEGLAHDLLKLGANIRKTL